MTKTTIISGELLSKFITLKKLSGTVAFLEYLQKRNHLKDFSIFCKRNSYKLHLPEKLPSGVLFHGSEKLQSLLIPNISIGPNGKTEKETLVYATDDPNYGIFLAVLNLKNGSASVIADGKKPKLFVDIDFINGPSKIKNGFVHIVSNQSFRKIKNKECVIDTTVPILFIISVKPQDLTVPIYIQTK